MMAVYLEDCLSRRLLVSAESKETDGVPDFTYGCSWGGGGGERSNWTGVQFTGFELISFAMLSFDERQSNLDYEGNQGTSNSDSHYPM